MVTRARKEVPANTPNPSGSRLRAFNSVVMMTRSQLSVSARTPRTPLREVLIVGRSLRTSLIMFHNETTPHFTPSESLKMILEGGEYDNSIF